MTPDVLVFLAGVVMASTGQVLMKLGALRGRTSSLAMSFLHPAVLAGYALMLGSTVTSTIALKTLPLRLVVSLLPLGYILVVLLSVSFLHERMKRHHLIGMIVILAGIIVFNLERA
jgi:uncharacterized membrane protein